MAKLAKALDLESSIWEFESLSLYYAPLAQLAEAKDLKSLKSKFESWVGYKQTRDVTVSIQGFDPCCKGSNPFGFSKLVLKMVSFDKSD